MEYFNTLPVEIKIDILSRVPTESVMDCKLVSKTWKSLVCNHQMFAQMHFNRINHPSSADSSKLGFLALVNEIRVPRIGCSDEGFIPPNQELHYFELDENHTTPIGRIRKMKFTPPFKHIIFVGSVHGLICLAQWQHPFNNSDTLRSLCICNPMLREYVMLPEIRKDIVVKKNLYIPWMLGFGYVSSTNEYKVIGMYMYAFEYVEVYIYTLGSGLGWRNLGKFYSNKYNSSRFVALGFIRDGTFLWKNNNKEITTYDFAEEIFCEDLSLPALQPESYYEGMGVLDGFFFSSIRRPVVEGNNSCDDIWLLRKKNENHDKQEQEQEEHQPLGWTKEFAVEFLFDNTIFAVTKTCGVLTYDDHYVNIYDTKASTWERLVDFKEDIHQVFPHKHTFFSLKEFGEKDTKTMVSEEM